MGELMAADMEGWSKDQVTKTLSLSRSFSLTFGALFRSLLGTFSLAFALSPCRSAVSCAQCRSNSPTLCSLCSHSLYIYLFIYHLFIYHLFIYVCYIYHFHLYLYSGQVGEWCGLIGLSPGDEAIARSALSGCDCAHFDLSFPQFRLIFTTLNSRLAHVWLAVAHAFAHLTLYSLCTHFDLTLCSCFAQFSSLSGF